MRPSFLIVFLLLSVDAVAALNPHHILQTENAPQSLWTPPHTLPTPPPVKDRKPLVRDTDEEIIHRQGADWAFNIAADGVRAGHSMGANTWRRVVHEDHFGCFRFLEVWHMLIPLTIGVGTLMYRRRAFTRDIQNQHACFQKMFASKVSEPK